MPGFDRPPPIKPTYRNLTHGSQMKLTVSRQQKRSSRSEPPGYFSTAPHSRCGLLPTTTSGRNYYCRLRSHQLQIFHGYDVQYS